MERQDSSSEGQQGPMRRALRTMHGWSVGEAAVDWSSRRWRLLPPDSSYGVEGLKHLGTGM